ncbi:hypothetical protein BGW39_003925 [Mortierella sp. 14UC]|nr:hypothetical protein BGW39_003925 [Mortierella sp. 14UC]
MPIEQRVQGVRPLYRNDNNTTKSSATAGTKDPDVIHIAIHLDTADREVVFWEDVLIAFKNALNIRQGSLILPFLRGRDFLLLHPLRIAAVPSKVLDVYLEEPPRQMDPVLAAIATLQAKVEIALSHEWSSPNTPTIAFKPRDPNNSNSSSTTTTTAALNIMSIENDNSPSEGGPSGNTPPKQVQLMPGQDSARLSLFHSSNSNVKKSRSRSPSSTSTLTSELDNGPSTTALNHFFERLIRRRRQEDTGPIIAPEASAKVHADTVSDNYTDTDEDISDHSDDDVTIKVESPSLTHTPQEQQQASIDDDIKNIPKGLRGLVARAMQGDAKSQYQLAVSYRNGSDELSQNDKLAMEWYNKAADQGHTKAQYCLGEYYDEGFSVPKDYVKAVEWYLKAARQGDVDAQFLVGLRYEYGQGVSQDKSKAMGWYFKAVNAGYKSARSRYGSLRDKGYTISLEE